MTYDPITEFEIENHGCIRKATFSLTPLHALIGPNDGGKSTVLRALRTLAQFAGGDFGKDANTQPVPFDPMLDMAAGCTRMTARFRDGLGYRIITTDPKQTVYSAGQAPSSGVEVRESVLTQDAETPPGGKPRAWNHLGILQLPSLEQPSLEQPLLHLKQRLTTATMVRFDPEALRAPSKLIPDSLGVEFADERGTGLAAVYDAIMNRDAEAFLKIQAEVRALFPSVQKLGLVNTSDSRKVIAATLVDGTRVGPAALSEGFLYFLGFAALRQISASRLLLIEEPENGLHPARIPEVMRILREISAGSQVIIATHSPLVVNELEGREVSVVTRDSEQGTQAVLLAETPNYRERSEIYLNGELWVAYGDGCSEQALVQGGPRP